MFFYHRSLSSYYFHTKPIELPSIPSRGSFKSKSLHQNNKNSLQMKVRARAFETAQKAKLNDNLYNVVPNQVANTSPKFQYPTSMPVFPQSKSESKHSMNKIDLTADSTTSSLLAQSRSSNKHNAKEKKLLDFQVIFITSQLNYSDLFFLEPTMWHKKHNANLRQHVQTKKFLKTIYSGFIRLVQPNHFLSNEIQQPSTRQSMMSLSDDVSGLGYIASASNSESASISAPFHMSPNYLTSLCRDKLTRRHDAKTRRTRKATTNLPSSSSDSTISEVIKPERTIFLPHPYFNEVDFVTPSSSLLTIPETHSMSVQCDDSLRNIHVGGLLKSTKLSDAIIEHIRSISDDRIVAKQAQKLLGFADYVIASDSSDTMHEVQIDKLTDDSVLTQLTQNFTADKSNHAGGAEPCPSREVSQKTPEGLLAERSSSLADGLDLDQPRSAISSKKVTSIKTTSTHNENTKKHSQTVDISNGTDYNVGLKFKQSEKARNVTPSSTLYHSQRSVKPKALKCRNISCLEGRPVAFHTKTLKHQSFQVQTTNKQMSHAGCEKIICRDYSKAMFSTAGHPCSHLKSSLYLTCSGTY